MTFIIQAIKHSGNFNFNRIGGAFFGMCALIFFFGATCVTGQTPAPAPNDAPDAPQAQLDESKSYDSLADAVKAVQTAERQDSPQAAGDSTFALSSKIVAADGAAQDRLGWDIAVSGDTAAISALTSTGAVYIFTRSAANVWTQQQKITAPVATAYEFAFSLALEGNTLVVGARSEEVGAAQFKGAVYVFTRSGTTWTQQQRLIASDGAAMDFFGHKVDISGNTIVVGANYNDVNGIEGTGAAYVFVRTGTSWTQQQKIRAADAAAGDSFGTSVAIDGNTIVCGSVYDTVGTNNAQGSAYVFNRIGTSWTQQQRIVAPDGVTNDAFGASVDIDGSSIVVGSENNGTNAAYVFVRPGGSFTFQQKLAAPSSFNYVGSSVAIDGDTAVVGSAIRSVGINIRQGAVFVFKRAGTAWTHTQQINAPDGHGDDRLGISVALDGSTLISGALFDMVNGNISQGSAYFFQLGNAGYGFDHQIVGSDSDSEDLFGTTLAVTTDTAVVGVPNRQSIYIFAKTQSGAWTFQQKINPGDFNYGRSVAVHENTIVVGADNVAYVYARTGTTWALQQSLNGAGIGGVAGLGASVAIENNLVIVGAPQSTFGQPNVGMVIYYERTGTTWQRLLNITPTDGVGGDNFGATVALSNNRLVIGAPNQTVGNAIGAVYVYEPFVNNSMRFSFKQKLTTPNETTERGLGASLAVQNDLIVAGSQRQGNRGAAFVFALTGANNTYVQQQKLQASDGANGDRFGFSVAIANDKILVGAPFNDEAANADQGAGYVFYKTGATWTESAKINAANGAAGDQFGASVGFIGESALIASPGDDVGANANQGSIGIYRTSATNSAAPFDFDGDGKSDIGVYRPSNGGWYVYNLANGQNTSQAFGLQNDTIVPADYDGDGKTDVAVYRGGTWYLNRTTLGFTGIQFGTATDVPAPADFDGDGKTDLAVFRPSNGGWYIYNLASGQNSSFAFGLNGDRPVPADYDGDGKADIAVFRAGTWYLQRSTLGFTGIQFGEAGDKTVQADYDGDGKCDVAVFRPSNGYWYVLQSTAGFKGAAFGQTGDAPAPADYDGDGKADFAVFRSGVWYLQRTTAGFTGIQFGTATDTAVSNAYVR